MALRKGRCYNKINKMAYTRKSKVRSKSYIKAISQTKVPKFLMGDTAGFNQGKYNYIVSLRLQEPTQVRDNALEASRQFIQRHLDKKVKNYFLIVSTYPHHVLRENRTLTGAGADRLQTGMKLSFGTSINIAARVPEGGKVFSIACNKEAVRDVRKILDMVKTKIPGHKVIVVEEMKWIEIWKFFTT